MIGGPEPTGDRRVRWGLGAGEGLREEDKKKEQAAVAKALDPPKAPGEAIADLIKENAHIGEVFEGLSKGDSTDPGVMARTFPPCFPSPLCVLIVDAIPRSGGL